jgi:hypothetical protein
MRQRSVTIIAMLLAALILAFPSQSQQKRVAASTEAKPFTQDQVQAMVRDGLGDETGAKAIEQRGIDFAPTGYFLGGLGHHGGVGGSA